MMATQTKLDLKKALGRLYSPSATKCAVVDVPPLNILCVDGAGDPNTSQEFVDAVSALYTTAYTLKFLLKESPGLPDFTVMPLEALWWVPDAQRFSMEQKDAWLWRAFIVQPEHVTSEMVQDALVAGRKKRDLAALNLLRFERFEEGLAAQIMHIGPYADEQPTIERLHAFVEEQGFVLRGKHHEIYLSDSNRTAPEKMKTIVRHPVAPAAA